MWPQWCVFSNLFEPPKNGQPLSWSEINRSSPGGPLIPTTSIFAETLHPFIPSISLHPATVPQGFQLSKFINLCCGSHHFTSPLQMVSKSAGISTFQGWSTHGLHQSGDGRVGVRFFTQHRTHQGGPHDHGGYISNTEREGESYIYMWFTICRYIIPYTESYIYKWYVYEYYIGMRACIALFFQKNVVKYDQYRRMFCGNHQDMYLDHNWRNRQQNWYNIPKWVVVWGVSRSSISATVWAKTHTGWWFQPRFKVSVSWDHPSKIFQIGLNNGEHEKMKPPTRHIVYTVYTVYTNKLFLSSPSMPSPPLFH